MGIVMKKLGQRGGPAGQDKEVMNTNNPTKKKKAASKMGGGAMKKKVMGYDKGGKITAAMKAKALKDYGKSGVKKGENPGKSIEDLILEVGMEQGVFSKKKGGSVRKYNKGGKMPLPKKKPRHANPNHPMNAERTTGHPDGVTRKTKGGKVKKYDKGGVTKDQKLAALKKAMKGMGKGGSGAGDSKMGKMIKEIGFPMSNKKAGGVVKKKAGGAMKPVPAGNKGLAKLPKPVRNRMGYAKKGGPMKKAYGMKHGGGTCRGGGAATRGKGYNKAG